MYITTEQLKDSKTLYSQGVYLVTTNLKRELLVDSLVGIEPQPNYIIVNKNTLAIEYMADQLPAAFEICTHLNDAVTKADAGLVKESVLN